MSESESEEAWTGGFRNALGEGATGNHQRHHATSPHAPRSQPVWVREGGAAGVGCGEPDRVDGLPLPLGSSRGRINVWHLPMLGGRGLVLRGERADEGFVRGSGAGRFDDGHLSGA